MTKANVTQYSATAGSNTDINDIDIGEGCSPATINNAIRELMSHLKNVDTGATTLTSPASTTQTITTLKTATVQYTDGDAAFTIANGGAVTIPNLVATAIDANSGSIDGATLGTNSAITQAVIDNVNIDGATIGHTSDTDLMTLASGLLTVAGEVSMTTLDIGGTNVTATASELNIMDGVTSSTAELNILDGVTATASELNILDGVTSTAAELNILDGVTSTAAELNKLDGVLSTTTELNITDGDTSVGTTAVAGGDGIVTNDNGTMRHTSVDTFDTYLAGTSKTLTNKTLTSPVLNTGVSGSAILDEDDMASNSATKLATQQSIKAYIDTSAGNAASSATASANSATASANSATASANSATLSTNYATETDSLVTGTSDDSAKSWAIGGSGGYDMKTSGKGDSKTWATNTTATADGTEYSAKEYAVGTQRRGAASGGSAKDWATYTGGTVDNSGYSAKYWAEQAASSHDSFDDKYLGSKSSAPSVDNDGASLTDGALYKNSSDGKLYFYNLSNTTWTAIETGATQGFATALSIAL